MTAQQIHTQRTVNASLIYGIGEKKKIKLEHVECEMCECESGIRTKTK